MPTGPTERGAGARESHADATPAEDLRRLRALVEAADLGFWDWDLRSGRVYYSDAWRRQLGYGEVALRADIGEWESRIHEQDRERMLASVRAFIKQPWPGWGAELRVRHADGSYRDVLMHLVLDLDAQGEPQRLLGSQLDITDNKRLELHEDHDRIHLLLDAVPHMISIMDLDGGVSYANAAWRAYYGHDFRRVTHSDRVARIHPEDHAAAVALKNTVGSQFVSPSAGPAPQTAPPQLFRLRGLDDVYHWFRVEAGTVHDAAGQPAFIVATATDVDALKQSQDSLSEAQARLQAALRVGGIGLLTWDARDGRVLWDDSVLCLIGRTREEMESRDLAGILELIHEDDREFVSAACARSLERGHTLELECRVLRPDGALTSLTVKGCTERHAHDQGARIIAAAVDITHRKQLEAEVLQAQKMDAIGQLAGGIAHDFNNLLTVILGQLSLLQLEPNLPGQVVDGLQDIDQAANRAAALTRQLLAFARRQLMQARTVDLNEAVAEALKMLRRIVGDGVTLEFEPAAEPVPARADTTMLSQLLLNLTVNARDASERGGRCIIRTSIEDLDETAAAHISGAKPGRWACVSVADTGSGIAPEVLPHVFEPFFTTKKLGQGTGLGLSTVYGILSQHGGFVDVETAVGQGSVFRAYLPWVPAATPKPAKLEHETRGPSPDAAKILLVEDEPAVRSLTRAVLEQRGYGVTVAENAHDAIRIWSEQRRDFDLLLTDMMMPGGMTGLELIEVLRREVPGLRAILCSGYSLDVALAKSAGGPNDVALLQKPWTAETLHQCVRQALGGVDARRHAGPSRT